MTDSLLKAAGPIARYLAFAKVRRKFARWAQEQAIMAYELMQLSGATKEDIQHHAAHSVYNLRDLLSIYKATGRWACCDG